MNNLLTNSEIVEKAYDTVDADDAAEYIAELLYDDSNSSYMMFEELASYYINGNDDTRVGIDRACAILTGNRLVTISQNLLEKAKKIQ